MYLSKLTMVLAFLLVITFSMPVHSASISGLVKQPSNYPAVGVMVTFTCPGNISKSVETDQYGRYRVRGLPDIQWCNLSVNYQEKDSAPVRVNSASGSKEINIKLKILESGLIITL